MLAKTKLINDEVLISNALTNSYISIYRFILVNNVSKEYDNMKEEIIDLKNSSVN